MNDDPSEHIDSAQEMLTCDACFALRLHLANESFPDVRPEDDETKFDYEEPRSG